MRGRLPGPRRRLLAALLVLTAAVALVDLAGAAWPSRLREAGATVLGPVLRAVGPREDEADRLRADRLRLADELRRTRVDLAATRGAQRLLESPQLRGAALVPARVVAVGALAADGARRVTLDVGSRDGVAVDETVVSPEGLVGRTVAVGPWTSDVLLVGATDVAVGVRVGPAGVLGIVDGATTAATARPAGTLGLALVDRGRLAVGDVVTTLGSPGGRPFVAGVTVGRVRSIDPVAGRLSPTAVVDPAVDLSTLDVVAVVLPGRRTTPRPAATATATAP